MATLLPPPKRQKVYHGVPAPEPETPKPSPNVIVQFVAEEDGKSLAPAVSLPANISREALQTLVNKLNSQVREDSSCVQGPLFESALVRSSLRTTIRFRSLFIYLYLPML